MKTQATSYPILSTSLGVTGTSGIYLVVVKEKTEGFGESDYSPEEKQSLVRRLDAIKDESLVTFSSTPEAIQYLRSLAYRSE